MDQKLVIDNKIFQGFPTVWENTKSSSNKNFYIGLGVVFFLAAAVGLVLFFVYKKKPTLPASQSARFFHGYIKSGEKYVNVGTRIFPEHDTNLSTSLILETTPKTTWTQEFSHNNKKNFSLRTELFGMIFSIQKNPPGLGTEWGIVYIAPIASSKTTNQTVFFNSDFQALEGPWSENETFLGSSESGNMVWLSSKTLPKLAIV